MPYSDYIEVVFECQGFKSTHIGISPEKDKTVLFMESTRKTKDVRCVKCGSEVYLHEDVQTHLTDMPIWLDTKSQVFVQQYRYRCKKCNKTFVEEIPFKYPGTRITYRAAAWIRGMLQSKISIREIQKLTGIHWDTIRKVQCEIMDLAIWSRQQELKEQNHKPRFLAIDEFAIHKGHSYATCVMDLETGDILWVGAGRTLKDFEKFFADIAPDTLLSVIAVAMDMNASYNKLVTEYLPNATIVYDRFHMQAQYGREVLGTVRLDEARKHKSKAKEILNSVTEDDNKEQKREKKQEAKAEKQLYGKLKKLRWPLLSNSENLQEIQNEFLTEILKDHRDLAVCYAMKEEMCRLYKETDYHQACIGWGKWFEAAKASGIPALVKFAQQKECRIQGLSAHAIFPISTGKLEGFNNKIKVAKRIGYGYRNESYFFMLIRYLSIPSVRLHGIP